MKLEANSVKEIKAHQTVYVFSQHQMTAIITDLETAHKAAWENSERGIAALIGDSLEILKSETV